MQDEVTENYRKLQKFQKSLLFWIHTLAGTSWIPSCEYTTPIGESRHGEPAISPSFSFILLIYPALHTVSWKHN